MCCVSPSSIVIHNSVFENCGIFDENFPVCEDYELWLRIKKYTNYYNLQEYLVLREIKKDNFNLNDVYFSSLARLKHINFFLALIFNLKDLIVYFRKKLITN